LNLHFFKWINKFKYDLSLGSRNSQVKELQKYLNNNGFVVAKTGPGSPGKETNIFGELTKLTLEKFQRQNNIKAL
jgi:peptidoglycan hydrolase-like protein with peptidoglycan-binding domain